MRRIYARITDEQEEKLKQIAKENNFVKPGGDENISQVIRWLIDKEEVSKGE